MFVGTMLVGPNETNLERALQSFVNSGVEDIFTLIDTVSPERLQLLEKYNCRIIQDKWDYNWGRSRTILQKALPRDADWQIWLDDDDEITAENGVLIKEIAQTDADRVIYIPYIYIENGIETYRLERERMFPARDVVWQLHSHESPEFPVEYKPDPRYDISIYHHRCRKEGDRSSKIIEGLELDLENDSDSPRILFYLGQTNMEIGDYAKAGNYFERYLLAGGWSEERMTACIHLSNLYQHHMKDNPTSLMYALRAKEEAPNDRREVYQRIGEIYFAMNELDNAYRAFMYETSIPYPSDAKMFIQNHLYKATPHIWLLFVCEYLKKFEELKYHLIEASQYNPTDTNVQKYMAKSNVSPKKTTIPYAIITRTFTQKLQQAFGLRALNGAEIGVNRGNNANEMLQELNIQQLYLIDPYKYYDGYNDNAGDLVEFEKYAHERLEQYNEKITWIKKQSEDAANDIPDNLDFVYIDGNHEYIPVLKDLKAYYPKVRIGGCIGGGDIFGAQSYNGRFGVLPALNQFCLERGLTSESDDSGVNFWIKRKPVAFFHVGYSCERWTSQSIHTTGIGGRETSNVNMAKEMQDLGWQVVLFADCAGQEGIYDDILQVDYRKFYDYCKDWVPDMVFISMRYSILDTDFPAKNIVFWAHDMHFGKSLEEWPDYPTPERLARCDYFFFMSPFQKEYLQKHYDMPEEKSYLTRSGIVPELFMHKNIKRNRHRMIYSSSPDRGLERLLQWWLELKQAIPELELHVFYGFLNMLQAAKKDPPDVAEQKIAWVNGLKDTMDRLDGVYYHDRIPQEKLAREFLESSLWGYSSAFLETMCLSALEACASGCPIVTTKLAALQTTVGEYGILIDADPDSMEYKRQFIEEVKRLMTDDRYWIYWSEKAKENIYDRQNKYGTIYWSWKAIAEEWNDYLLDKLNPVVESVPKIYTEINWQGIQGNLNLLYKDSRIGQEYEFRIPNINNKLNQYLNGQKNIYEILEMIYSFKWMGNKSFLRSEIAKAGFAVTGLVAEGEDLIATFKRTEWLENALQDVYDITGQIMEYPGALEAKGCWPLEFPFLANYDVKQFNHVVDPLVSVILSCRNWVDERTKPTVAILQKRLEENPGMVEFIAVDDASSDGTNEFLSQNCDTLITMRSRRGLADVYNAGIKHSHAPYILIMQNDILLDVENFFPKLISVYENHLDVGLLTPFLKDNIKYELSPKTIVEDAFLYDRLPNHNNVDPIRVGIHPSVCVLGLRERFVEAGLYDPYQYLTWEDHDMCRKFDDNGYIMGVAKDIQVSPLKVETTFIGFDMPETIRRMASYIYFCLKYNYLYSKHQIEIFQSDNRKDL